MWWKCENTQQIYTDSKEENAMGLKIWANQKQLIRLGVVGNMNRSKPSKQTNSDVIKSCIMILLRNVNKRDEKPKEKQKSKILTSHVPNNYLSRPHQENRWPIAAHFPIRRRCHENATGTSSSRALAWSQIHTWSVLRHGDAISEWPQRLRALNQKTRAQEYKLRHRRRPRRWWMPRRCLKEGPERRQQWRQRRREKRPWSGGDECSGEGRGWGEGSHLMWS